MLCKIYNIQNSCVVLMVSNREHLRRGCCSLYSAQGTMKRDQCYTQANHQGCHITEGAIRSAGFWIIGSKHLVSSVINKCVICHQLRGMSTCYRAKRWQTYQLTDSFTNVGLDVFGPWSVMTHRTRGGSVDSKQWAMFFTCM